MAGPERREQQGPQRELVISGFRDLVTTRVREALPRTGSSVIDRAVSLVTKEGQKLTFILFKNRGNNITSDQIDQEGLFVDFPIANTPAIEAGDNVDRIPESAIVLQDPASKTRTTFLFDNDAITRLHVTGASSGYIPRVVGSATPDSRTQTACVIRELETEEIESAVRYLATPTNNPADMEAAIALTEAEKQVLVEAEKSKSNKRDYWLGRLEEERRTTN